LRPRPIYHDPRDQFRRKSILDHSDPELAAIAAAAQAGRSDINKRLFDIVAGCVTGSDNGLRGLRLGKKAYLQCL
jgi:hypothetical protein